MCQVMAVARATATRAPLPHVEPDEARPAKLRRSLRGFRDLAQLILAVEGLPCSPHVADFGSNPPPQLFHRLIGVKRNLESGSLSGAPARRNPPATSRLPLSPLRGALVPVRSGRRARSRGTAGETFLTAGHSVLRDPLPQCELKRNSLYDSAQPFNPVTIFGEEQELQDQV